MQIKESSDELNAPVVTTGVSIAVPVGRRSLSDYLALAIATCGVGYLPLAPGTWGSIVGVCVYLLWQRFIARGLVSYFVAHELELFFDTFKLMLMLISVSGLTLAGVWAATRVEKVLGRKDPGIVVIDEVAGQLIALSFLPLTLEVEWPLVIAGFLLFRTFDIWKPYPIRRLESLESGLGIMADDVLAGFYAAILLSLLALVYLFI